MAASKYKEGQVIFGRDGKVFIILYTIGCECAKCSFSRLFNPHYDLLQSCESRKRYYLGETGDCHSYSGDSELLPKNCCFKDITKGV